LFGDRFWSRTVTSDEQLVKTCRYVIENPVRAGLCSTPEEWPWSALEPGLREHEQKEHDADHAVHREERRIQPAQIAGPHKRVLVGEENAHRRNAEPVPPASPQTRSDRGEKRDRQRMEQARTRERAAHAEARRSRMQTLRKVD